jgi:hypothetical protein
MGHHAFSAGDFRLVAFSRQGPNALFWVRYIVELHLQITPAKKKPELSALAIFWIKDFQRIPGGKWQFRTADPCSVNAMLYP